MNPLSRLRGRVRPRERMSRLAAQKREEVTASRYARWRRQPVEQRAVLYESFGGNGVLDNPEAIFRHLLTQPDMADLRHIWSLRDMAAHREVVAEFSGDPRVRFVETGSPDYLHVLATSKYLINNATFPQQFAKRPEQVYVNTWHGVPLKHMGFDMPGGGPDSRNIVRNYLQADFLLSANPFMTDTMYRTAYRMQGIFPGAVIEEGQPRTDRQMEVLRDPAPARALLETRGTRIDDRAIVLYAPTWRGDSFASPHVNAAQLLAAVRELQANLDATRYVVLLKVHQTIYDAVRERVGDCDFLVPNSVPTNIVLGISDLVITDYSSIFFDYLATGRPVVHYVPDLDDYRSERGLYLTEDELFGPVCAAMPDLIEHVRSALADPGGSRRSEEGAARFTAKDDGSVCARVVDLVFRDADEAAYTVHRDFGTDKERLLIYLGGMKSNGIMTSALNLLKNLDYDRYDVTGFYVYSRGRDRVKNMALVDPRVRVIPRVNIYNASPRRAREEVNRLLEEGLPEILDERHNRFWTDEWQRIFGAAQFDHLIDFSGYGCFSPFLFTVAETGRKSIWLHNDMMSDMQRETVGEKHLEDRLQAVFSTYRHFDHLVSVSPELNAVNVKGLSAYARPEQFTYAINTIDGERVVRMAGGQREGTPELRTFDTKNLAAAVSTLLEHFTADGIISEARSRSRLPTSTTGGKPEATFVTVGRLSPEKNHARLIRAFAQVHERHPDIRLVILGGGKLEDQLNEVVVSLGMEGHVTLAGQVDNPYAIMADADCFVLSSDYEGQPMVILEARTLGLPVITTAFSSVGDSVPDGAGIVVPQSVKGVAAGLERFLAGDVPSSTLDCVAYNHKAMEQFDAALHS